MCVRVLRTENFLHQARRARIRTRVCSSSSRLYRSRGLLVKGFSSISQSKGEEVHPGGPGRVEGSFSRPFPQEEERTGRETVFIRHWECELVSRPGHRACVWRSAVRCAGLVFFAYVRGRGCWGKDASFAGGAEESWRYIREEGREVVARVRRRFRWRGSRPGVLILP